MLLVLCMHRCRNSGCACYSFAFLPLLQTIVHGICRTATYGKAPELVFSVMVTHLPAMETPTPSHCPLTACMRSSRISHLNRLCQLSQLLAHKCHKFHNPQPSLETASCGKAQFCILQLGRLHQYLAFLFSFACSCAHERPHQHFLKSLLAEVAQCLCALAGSLSRAGHSLVKDPDWSLRPNAVPITAAPVSSARRPGISIKCASRSARFADTRVCSEVARFCTCELAADSRARVDKQAAGQDAYAFARFRRCLSKRSDPTALHADINFSRSATASCGPT